MARRAATDCSGNTAGSRTRVPQIRSPLCLLRMAWLLLVGDACGSTRLAQKVEADCAHSVNPGNAAGALTHLKRIWFPLPRGSKGSTACPADQRKHAHCPSMERARRLPVLERIPAGSLALEYKCDRCRPHLPPAIGNINAATDARGRSEHDSAPPTVHAEQATRPQKNKSDR